MREIIATDAQITLAAMQGNAGAGGAFLALAADRVYARDGVILNPHYKGMGNLYGSEYWTYLLPRRVGAEVARVITQGRLPIGAHEAADLGLIDDHFGTTPAAFRAEVKVRANALAADPAFGRLLDEKNARRRVDEARKPLETYRAEELERMKQNFFGFDPSYHVARDHFVRKVPRSRTPLHLARHRVARVRDSGPGLQLCSQFRAQRRSAHSPRWLRPSPAAAQVRRNAARAMPSIPATTNPRAPAYRPPTLPGQRRSDPRLLR